MKSRLVYAKLSYKGKGKMDKTTLSSIKSFNKRDNRIAGYRVKYKAEIK